MKPITQATTAILTASLLAFSGVAVASSGQCAHHGKAGPHVGQQGERHGGGHAHDGSERHERMAELLGLDASQREAFDELRESHQAQREQRHEQKREMRREMLGASAPDQMRLKAEHMRAAAERMEERAETMDAFYQTLDENQRRMVDRLKGSGMYGMKHGGKGGHDDGHHHGHRMGKAGGSCQGH
ncbi:MAG: Spy/CpxP family protein refolding chaperone [Guyparkeria sp.]